MRAVSLSLKMKKNLRASPVFWRPRSFAGPARNRLTPPRMSTFADKYIADFEDSTSVIGT